MRVLSPSIDIASLAGSGVAPKRQCIVSRDPIPSSVFVAALTTALSPGDELEIIVDRRRGSSRTEELSIERRRRPHVDRALQLDGFAIVPTLANGPAENSSLKLPRVPAASPFESLSLADMDEPELERIIDFKRRRKARLRLWLILAGLGSVILLVLLVLSPAVKTRLSQVRPAAPPTAALRNVPPAVAPAPPVARTLSATPAPLVAEPPSPNSEVRASPLAGRLERPGAERPQETSALPRTVRGPNASILLQKGMAFPATAPRFEGLPRVELVHNPAPMSEGGGEAYVVRLSDTAGRPLAGVEVSLLIRLADSAPLNVPLESGPEPGTYHATVPPLQPTPADLRIRVVTSDKLFEIPLTP